VNSRAAVILLFVTVTGVAARDNPRDVLAELGDSLFASLSDTVTLSRLVVLPFADKTRGEQSSRGTAIAEYFIGRLQREERFTVVDRSAFKDMIAEIELSQTDLIDESSAVTAGKMLAADAILTGTIAEVFGKSRISAKIIRTETSEILTSASVVAAPAALDGLTKKLLGERTQVSATAFRSLLLPGWGQFYSNQYTRGSISLAACGAMAGYTIFSIVKTHNARVERDNWRNYMDSEEYQTVRSTTSETWEDGMAEYRALDREYGEQFDRAVVAGIITGGVWTLNVVDALIAGVQAKRRFEPYFAHDARGGSGVGVCVRF
jgi:TolB-like protein